MYTEMMIGKGQEDIIKNYNMQPFGVLVLSKERTFCEKIMSLVRFYFTEYPYTDLTNKIRHIYDLHMMIKNTEVKTFFDSSEFDLMLNKAGEDDVLSFKNNKDRLTTHPAEALIFKAPEDTWGKIRQPYQTTFKDLVIGTLPAEADLLITIKAIAERLKKTKWKIITV